jgi:predicted transcriptional regulator
VTVAPTDSIEAVVERMRSNGIRRVPVVEDQRVVGIVSLDDLLVDAARDLEGLTSPLAAEIASPQRDSPTPSRR